MEDPAAGSSGVGSGGATLNAMMLVAEYLSARTGQTVVDAGEWLCLLYEQRMFSFLAYEARRPWTSSLLFANPCAPGFTAIHLQTT